MEIIAWMIPIAFFAGYIACYRDHRDTIRSHRVNSRAAMEAQLNSKPSPVLGKILADINKAPASKGDSEDG